MRRLLYSVCLLAALALSRLAAASPWHGQVNFAGLPLPGATVTVTQGAKTLSTTTDQGGLYTFNDLPDGAWTIDIAMLCFKPIRADVTISPTAPPGKWDLTLLPLEEIARLATLPPTPLPALAPAPAATKATNNTPVEIPKPSEDASQQGFLVNGSVNNAATSRFSLDRAFGNRRTNSRSLYTGGLAAIIDNSALDARPYSLSGLNTPKPSFNRITGVLTLGGPIRIPRVLPRGPTFFLAYVWRRDRTAETDSGLVPTDAERTGDLSGLLNALGQPVTVFNPQTGQPYPGNVVPVSPQAHALLQLYPTPNIAGDSLYNYQVPILNSTHLDVLQSRLDQTIGHRDEVYGNFNLQSTRASGMTASSGSPIKPASLGINTNINWSHRINQRLFFFAGLSLQPAANHSSHPISKTGKTFPARPASPATIRTQPTGDPPAAHLLERHLTPLTDEQSAFNRNRTDGFSGSVGHISRPATTSPWAAICANSNTTITFQQNPRGDLHLYRRRNPGHLPIA